MKKAIASLIAVAVIVIACSKSSTALATVDCSGAAKSFETDVSPVIQTFCATNAGCHGTGSINGPGALTTYQQVFNARSSIRVAVANGTMPLNGSLTAAQRNAILCWIDNGSGNN